MGVIDRALTPGRVRGAAWVVLGLACIAALLNVVLGDLPGTAIGTVLLPDWFAHWTGGRLILDGQAEHLYDPAVQQALQDSVTGGRDDLAWFVSPPMASLLYVPFALMPYVASAFVWAVVTVVLLVVSALLLRPLLPAYDGRALALAALVVAASQPLLELVGGGQDSAVLLLLWVVALRLLDARRDAAAGVVLGLMLIKPQLVVLAPLVLLMQRRWRALATFVLTSVALLAVSVVVVGPGSIGDWLDALSSQRFHEVVQVAQSWMMHGLPSQLVALAPESWGSAAQVVGLVIGAGLVVAMLLAVRRAPTDAVMPVWSLVMITTMVVTPHVLSYDLVLLAPAALHLMRGGGTRTTRLSLLAIVVLTWTAWPRHELGHVVPWLGWVGTSWVVIPLLLLWRESWHEVSATRQHPSALSPARDTVP